MGSFLCGRSWRSTFGFDIFLLYCENFDPNTQKYKVYAQDVDKIELSGLLMELSKMYFDQFGSEIIDSGVSEMDDNTPQEVDAYQCQDCLTIYDDSFGDKTADIEVNTMFKNLPMDYQCDVCGGSKENYKAVKLQY